MIIGICVLMLGLTWWLSRKLFHDVFTPLLTFTAVWCTALIGFEIRLISYLPIRPRTYGMVIGSILAFILGCLVVRLRPVVARQPQLLDQRRLELVIRILILATLGGAVLFAIRIDGLYGITTYLIDPSIIRANAEDWVHSGALAMLTSLHYPLFACSALHTAVTRKLSRINVSGVVVACGTTALSTERATLVIFMATGAFIFVYLRGYREFDRRMMYRAALLGLLVLAYFTGMATLYNKSMFGEDTRSSRSTAAYLNSSNALVRTIAAPYAYGTGGFGALDQAIDDVGELSWGARTFYPAARLLNRAGVIEKLPEWTDFGYYSIPIPFNTYPQIFWFYEDFGWAGVLIVSFLLGAIQTRTYMHMRARPTFLTVTSTAGMIAFDLLSTYGALITTLLAWYYFVVVWLVSLWCMRSFVVRRELVTRPSAAAEPIAVARLSRTTVS